MSLERAKEEVKFVLPKSFQAATAPAAEQDLISRRWREAAEKPSSRSFTLADDAPEPWEAWEKSSSAAASAKSGREGYEKRGTLPEHNEDVFEENKKFLLEREQKKEQERIDPKTLTFRGELFHTYLIYEAGDEAYFIDQHAAHERLLFEKLTRRLEQSAPLSQPLLLPYVKSVSPQEFAFLCKNFDILRSFGFEIEEFGSSSVKISSVPLDLFGMDADAFLNEALSSMESLRFIKLPDILRDRLASMACKAAVKGGEELSEREVQALISEMDGNMGLKCPHGRPACVKFKKSELEKLFKRTV